MKKTLKRLTVLLLMAALLSGMLSSLAFAGYSSDLTPTRVTTDTKMSLSVNRAKDSNATTTNLYYTVVLAIGDDLAETAAVYKDVYAGGVLKMKAMRFACYMEDALIKNLLPEAQIPTTLENNEIFDYVSKEKTTEGAKIIFKVKDDVCDRWETSSMQDVCSELKSANIFFKYKASVPTDQLRSLCQFNGATYYLESKGGLLVYPSEGVDISHSHASFAGDTITVDNTGNTIFKVGTLAGEDAIGAVEVLAAAGINMSYFAPDELVNDCIYRNGLGFWVDGQRPESIYHGYAVIPEMLNGDDHFAYLFGYNDNTVRPDKTITRAEVATIFYRLLRDDVRSQYFTRSNSFSDVNAGNWFNTAVSTMANAGIVNGYPDGTFRPNAPITRAEFATITAKFDSKSASSSSTFTDVAGHWAKQYIDRAAELGWITGYGDGSFRPNQNITRAEAATMINRVLNRAPQSASDLLSNMTKWVDNANTSAWYYLAIQEATNSHSYATKNNGYETWQNMLANRTWTEN